MRQQIAVDDMGRFAEAATLLASIRSPEGFKHEMTRLEALFSARASVVCVSKGGPDQPVVFAAASGLQRDFLARHVELVEQDPGRRDQIAVMRSGRPRLITPAIFNRRVRSDSRYYQELVRPLACSPLGIALMADEHCQLIYGLFREHSSPFTSCEANLLWHLAPMLGACAAQMYMRAEIAQQRTLIDLLQVDGDPGDPGIFHRRAHVISQPTQRGAADSDTRPQLLRHRSAPLMNQLVRFDYAPGAAPPVRALPTRTDGTAASQMSVRGTATKPQPLTWREAQVVELAGAGYDNRTIAARLHLSQSTVSKHLTSAYAKLGVTGRSALFAVTTNDGAQRHLTKRQWQIAHRLLAGQCTKVIAAELAISLNTTFNHIRAMHSRFGTSSRPKLLRVLRALSHTQIRLHSPRPD